MSQTNTMRNQVWQWLHDPQNELNGLLALNENNVAIGLAHYRSFYRPLSATKGGFIDDLFVIPDARGKGTGTALINAVVEIGRQHHWSIIRWITAEDNIAARSAYDKIATKTKWLTYDIKL